MGGGKANTIGDGNGRYLEGRGPAKPGHCKSGACKAGQCTIGQRRGPDKRNLVKQQIVTDCCHAIKKLVSCCKFCCTHLSRGSMAYPIQDTEPLKLDQNNSDNDDASE